jgi:methylenetetrahydrofolate reductase (NADPH)
MIGPTTEIAVDASGLMVCDERSRFHRRLEEQRPIITAELAVPATVLHDVIIERARELQRPEIVAVNITDGLRGRPALSPIAAAAILTHADLGIEPILQLTARSRARNALVADLLGASALGVRNLLCMTGDFPEHSADVQDLDVFGLIALARAFPADLGIELLGPAAPFCVGAAWSPFSANPTYEVERLVRKHASGAQFVQTQPVFDARAFAAALDRLPTAIADLPIIMGLAPVRSADHARRLAAIPGIVIPQRLVDLLESGGQTDGPDRYWSYLDEELDWLARNAFVSGCHLMPIGHSKRGMSQRSSFDRLYESSTKLANAVSVAPSGSASAVGGDGTTG